MARLIDQALGPSTLIYGGPEPGARLARITWAEVAHRAGIPLGPTSSAGSFTRAFPRGSWPRRLIGPSEGYLDGAERDALLDVLKPHATSERCFFYFWLVATVAIRTNLLFEGVLDDILRFPDEVPEVHRTPGAWFPADRSWFVSTDYDLTFTLVGGSQHLIWDLLDCPVLECLPVQPEMRVDSKADVS